MSRKPSASKEFQLLELSPTLGRTRSERSFCFCFSAFRFFHFCSPNQGRQTFGGTQSKVYKETSPQKLTNRRVALLCRRRLWTRSRMLAPSGLSQGLTALSFISYREHAFFLSSSLLRIIRPHLFFRLSAIL